MFMFMNERTAYICRECAQRNDQQPCLEKVGHRSKAAAGLLVLDDCDLDVARRAAPTVPLHVPPGGSRSKRESISFVHHCLHHLDKKQAHRYLPNMLKVEATNYNRLNDCWLACGPLRTRLFVVRVRQPKRLIGQLA